MNAIAGICQKEESGPLNPEVVTAMLRDLPHQGTPSPVPWLSDRVAFMPITIQSSGEPVRDAASGNRLIWNGRLDNRKELRELFKRDALGAGDQTDPELALCAFMRWGAEAPWHLVGDFAFAVWEARTRRLFCVRDAIGVKSIYYHVDGGRFVFSSELGTLLKLIGIPHRPNESMIAAYLNMDFQDSSGTFFDGIRQVPPGHVLCFDDGHLSLRRYWDIDPSRQTHFDRDEDYLEQFLDLFRDSVRCRLQGEDAVGILLSGGIDSCGVSAVAQEIVTENSGHPRVEGYTFLHPGFLGEEWEAIRNLIEIKGLLVHLIRQEQAGKRMTSYDVYLTTLETLHYEGFLTLPFMLERVAANKTGVLLTGFGADELFRQAEKGYVRDILRAGRIGPLLRELDLMHLAYGNSRLSLGLELLSDEVPRGARRLIKTMCGRNVPDWMEYGFAKRTTQARCHSTPPRTFSTLSQEYVYRTVTGPSVSLGLQWMATAARRYGIECRHPFLDRRIIEYVLSIPAGVKVRGGYRKMFFQRALQAARLLPVRPREGTSAIIPEANVQSELALDADSLSQRFLDGSPIYEFVTRPAVDRIRQRYLAGDIRLRNLLWQFGNLERWLIDYASGRLSPTEEAA